MNTVLLIGVIAAAQAAQAAQAPATCAAELAWASEYAARNYAGFETKTAGDAGTRYAALLAELNVAAAAATDEAACDAVLARWVAFFADGHLSTGRRTATADASGAEPAPDEIRARYATRPRRDITETDARARLAALGEARSPIEGIWEMGEGSYRGVVLRDDDAGTRYSMSILRADSVWWVPGQVKAIFTPRDDGAYDVRFFMRDHSERAWTGRVLRNVLSLDQGSPWFRTWPAQDGDVTAAAWAATRNGRFTARELAPGTVLLQLPSFDVPAAMDSLFEAEGDRIRAAERLVIDLRGNGGGSDYNFRMLLPLIYTNPIRMVSNAILATPANIEVNARLAADTTLPAAIRESLAGNVRQMQTAVGGWYEFEDRLIDELDVLERPARIDVVIDRGCASSCEQFLLAARQSRKVTTWGTRTAGILDFGNVRSARMPGGTLQLNYPTTRSKRLPAAPVDGIGIQPDVAVPADVIDPVQWLLGRT